MNFSSIRFVPGDSVADDLTLLDFAAFLAETARDDTRSLIVSWLDANERPVPAIVPIDDVPLEPDTEMFGGLSTVLESVLAEHAPGGSVVLVLARPGSAAITASDLAWDSALRTQVGIRVRGVFFAVGGGVRPITLDDAA